MYLIFKYLHLQRDLPVLLVDRSGLCIGVAAPPFPDPKVAQSMHNAFKKLRKHSAKSEKQKRKRGDFETLQHGIQMGPGHKASMIKSIIANN